MGVKLPGKKCYVTFEWPLCDSSLEKLIQNGVNSNQSHGMVWNIYIFITWKQKVSRVSNIKTNIRLTLMACELANYK